MILTGFMMYTVDTGECIDHLCLSNIDLPKIAIFIPHIGETFIDKTTNIEYEVKDVIRTLHNNRRDSCEYGIQVYLTKREKRKYK